MSAAKHTPGPWKVDLEVDKRPTVWTDENTDDRTRIARIACDPPEVDDVAYANAMADAHVIAAAPDLLSACEALVAGVEDAVLRHLEVHYVSLRSDMERLLLARMDRARAAIKQARGGV